MQRIKTVGFSFCHGITFHLSVNRIRQSVCNLRACHQICQGVYIRDARLGVIKRGFGGRKSFAPAQLDPGRGNLRLPSARRVANQSAQNFAPSGLFAQGGLGRDPGGWKMDALPLEETGRKSWENSVGNIEMFAQRAADQTGSAPSATSQNSQWTRAPKTETGPRAWLKAGSVMNW